MDLKNYKKKKLYLQRTYIKGRLHIIQIKTLWTKTI